MHCWTVYLEAGIALNSLRSAMASKSMPFSAIQSSMRSIMPTRFNLPDQSCPGLPSLRKGRTFSR